ncbi:glycosyltransferase family 4 protein [Pseudarthrobacter sp. NPDC055928]|uniref:glycosyltransferase family 4 protein n=1 Tax=Pseudarthrobacter sp. NPDC055928 TaxID=3345661 RepID=UPI0035DA376D
MHRVLIFAPFYPPAYLGGGPIRTISAIAQGAPERYLPAVITSDTDLGQQQPLPVPSGAWAEHEGVSTFYFSTKKCVPFAKALTAGRAKRPDILYLSSFFNVKFSLIPQILHLFGFFGRSRVVIAPRGEFGLGALAIKSTRKRRFINAYRLFRLQRHIIWHASSLREANDIHSALGKEATVLIRENDSALPQHSLAPSMQVPLVDQLRAVFIGRISVVKGLEDLIQSFADVRTSFKFDIYGPEEDIQYSARCRRAASELPSHIQVTFRGPIAHEKVRETLAGYDVMFFPTRGENFGHVIAEALSVSCPVVCADVTPWTGILEAGGGRVVRHNSSGAWSQEIQTYALMTSQERLAARVRAGQAFDGWRQLSPDCHIFEMVTDHLGTTSNLSPQERSPCC